MSLPKLCIYQGDKPEQLDTDTAWFSIIDALMAMLPVWARSTFNIPVLYSPETRRHLVKQIFECLGTDDDACFTLVVGDCTDHDMYELLKLLGAHDLTTEEMDTLTVPSVATPIIGEMTVTVHPANPSTYTTSGGLWVSGVSPEGVTLSQ